MRGYRIDMPHSAYCNVQRATCNMQHATCNVQHATCDVRHTAIRIANRLRGALRESLEEEERAPTTN
ncbi:hypothetical protein V9T40_009856 [Parthenolecanium corni]|uniref:Uncharacterized protein n=1 Tax=Parthenolecanium corni TaxID=536013 RepID=A0AAN9TML6_9HEMI